MCTSIFPHVKGPFRNVAAKSLDETIANLFLKLMGCTHHTTCRQHIRMTKLNDCFFLICPCFQNTATDNSTHQAFFSVVFTATPASKHVVTTCKVLCVGGLMQVSSAQHQVIVLMQGQTSPHTNRACISSHRSTFVYNHYLQSLQVCQTSKSMGRS